MVGCACQRTKGQAVPVGGISDRVRDGGHTVILNSIQDPHVCLGRSSFLYDRGDSGSESGM